MTARDSFYEGASLSANEIEAKANDLLAQMTVKEKVWLLNGNWDPIANMVRHRNPYNPEPIKTNGCPRLDVPPVAFTDGPRGIVMGHATCFPVSMARGASFDRDLESRVGDVIGREARALGANYFAGVCINLLRHPAWGRAQETYGEDPYHVGEFGKALTLAVQRHGVMACLKHYALNNIENSRFFVNVKVGARALREVYLAHFKKSVDAGAASLMGAYNLYDGDQVCENRELMTDILRDEWGFQGFTSSDFMFGIRDAKKALEAGMDVEMPMPVHFQKRLLRAVKKGEVSEDTLDLAALRVLRTVLTFDSIPDPESYSANQVACADHIALAREAAEQSMVLIKNEGAVLPFAKPARRVVVIGKLAAKENTGDHGSSRIYAPYVVTPLDGLKAYLGEGVEVQHFTEDQIAEAKAAAADADCVIFVAGNDARDEGEFVDPAAMGDGDKSGVSMDVVRQGYRQQGQPLKSLLVKWGLKLMGKRSYTAASANVAVGGDRASLSLKPQEIAAIKEIAPSNPNCVVTLIGGSMIMTREWDEAAPAILYGWYGGMEGGHALPRILFGDVSPSGKLPFTIPTDESHLPYFSSTDEEITYDLYHGYSKLDREDNKAHYPFGHGLSYSQFALEDIQATGGNDISVSLTVSNQGAMRAAEVVQVYIGKSDSAFERQKKLLKGFEKVWLDPGESLSVTIAVPRDEFAIYDERQKEWVVEPGDYQVLVGTSSADPAMMVAVAALT